MSEEEKKEEIIRVHCGECVGKRNHKIVAQHKYTDNFDDGYGLWMYYEYSIIQCCGCDHISFLSKSLFSEDVYPVGYLPNNEIDYQEDWTEKLYPPPIYRQKPEWFDDLPDPILQTIFDELYKSLQSESHFLATFGARTALDRLIVLKVGDKGNFKKGIKALQDQGLLSDHEKEILEPTLEAGHAAAHRGYTPSSEEMTTIMDTIESLVHRILVLPAKAELLKDAVPVRGGKKSKIEKKVNVPTVSERIDNSSKDLQELCAKTIELIKSIGDDVKRHTKKHYIAFRRSRNFVSLQIRNQRKVVVLYLNIDPDDIDLEDGFTRDVRTIGHYGTGNLEVLINSEDDLNKAKELIAISYKNS